MKTINPDERHFYLKDKDGKIARKYDRKAPLQVPDDMTVKPIRIPDHATDRSEALSQLGNISVDYRWDRLDQS